MRARRMAVARAAVAVAALTGCSVVGGQPGALAAATASANAKASNRAADRDQAAGGLARFERQKITWHGCQTDAKDELGKVLDQEKAQCAEVTVPLDYSHPGGRTIKVAMSRLKATDPKRRRGTLLINPGGPGDPGMIYAPLLKQADPEVAARYDVIGMDSRLVGRSTPLNCQWPIRVSLQSAGPDRRSFDQSAAFAEDLASRCASHKDVLPHASARNTARDMDVIRAALDEPKLSYLGGSYGTYLGAVYLQLFPARADRFVLDSALDPAAAGPGFARPMGPALAAALKDWATWAARHHDRYRLGATAAQVLATVNRVKQAAARRPLRIGNHRVDARLLPVILLFSLGRDSEEAYAEFAADMRVLSDAARGVKVTPSASLEESLAFVFSPDADGAESALVAISCADRAASRDPETYYRDIQAHRADEPLFGPMTRNISPCAFWPAAPAEPPTRIHNDVPALMVGSSGDPKTPYPGQQTMHRALAESRMVTVRGAYRHLVYGPFTAVRNTCIETAVNNYLLEGTLPANDTTCPKNPQ